MLYSMNVFVKSGRIAFEHHWGAKIGWFLNEALPNALSIFVLNDNNHRDHTLYIGCAALVGLLLVAGAIWNGAAMAAREDWSGWPDCSRCRYSPSRSAWSPRSNTPLTARCWR